MVYPDIMRVLDVNKSYNTALLALQNVVACGVGFKETDEGVTDEHAVVVSVSQKVPQAQLADSDMVPREIDGVSTDVIETGEFMAMPAAQAPDPRLKWGAPIPPGVSIGHSKVTAGTFGCLVRRKGVNYILSNNHVLANLNDAKPGDPIIQPGRHDGGTAKDAVAMLAEFVPLDFGGGEAESGAVMSLANLWNGLLKAFGSTHRLVPMLETSGVNKVDAAIALPKDASAVSAEILHIGRPRGIKKAELGLNVQKSGRSTGHTTGRIVQIEVSTQVSYGASAAAHFEGQLMASGMSSAGDSGSAVLDEKGNVVGLLFAGSDVATLITPIQVVLDALNVELVT